MNFPRSEVTKSVGEPAAFLAAVPLQVRDRRMADRYSASRLGGHDLRWRETPRCRRRREAAVTTVTMQL
jgi:hypothetical protein